LFVGNDFLRKGGDFLLRLYTRHLAGTCVLTIVSNDRALDGMCLVPGVRRIRNLTSEQLRPLYQESHLFLFPTRQDFMPQVLAEALALGLPCIANDVGGIQDLVHDGETGFLMPFDASPELWAKRIQHLASNPQELTKMSQRSRQFADARLGMDQFETLVQEVIGKLRAQRQTQAVQAPLESWRHQPHGQY